MNDRRFTLDKIHATAIQAGLIGGEASWERFKAALLGTKPQAKACFGTAFCQCVSGNGGRCEPCALAGCTYNTAIPCELKSAPADSSGPAWLPLGEHPKGRCRDWCGVGYSEDGTAAQTDGWAALVKGHWRCTPYCARRAKAAPKDSAAPVRKEPTTEPRETEVITTPQGTFRVVGTSKGVDWRSLPPGAWIRFGNDVRRMAERHHPLPADWESGKYELLERIPEGETSRPGTKGARDPGCCSDCHMGVPGGPCGCDPGYFAPFTPGKPDEAPCTFWQDEAILLAGTVDDLRAQLATRDARIAELESLVSVFRIAEARQLAKRDAAVLAERARVDRWWRAWHYTDDLFPDQRDEGIASGAAAPAGCGT